VTTGQPHAILSATTNPKESINVGYKNISAALKYLATSVWSTYQISQREEEIFLLS
jgi:hypothetical protein